MEQEIINNLWNFLPEITLAFAIIILSFLPLLLKKSSKLILSFFLLFLVLTLVFALLQIYIPQQFLFNGTFVIDRFASYGKILIIITTIIISVFLIINNKLQINGPPLLLIPSIALGSMLAVAASNLIALFISFELINISLYLLIYSKRKISIKYLITGLAVSGLMLYGITILYGLSGSMDYNIISKFLSENKYNYSTLIISVLLISSGLAYKILIFPFNIIYPSIAEKSESAATSVISIPAVIAGFSVITRFFLTIFNDTGSFSSSETAYRLIFTTKWDLFLAVLSAASIIIGNFVILWQTNLKRITAFTIISSCGYLLMGLISASPEGTAYLLAGLVIYSINSLGLIFCVELIESKFKITDIRSIKGIGLHSKILFIPFTIFIISSVGIVLTSGFIMKLLLFSSVISTPYYWLMIFGVLSQLVSMYFFFKLIVTLFQRKISGESIAVRLETGNKIILLLLTIPSILLGLYFSPLLDFARYCSMIFGMIFGI
ncbi:MAG: hypothetical protein L0Y79_06280 [Chlorobi bacterium]|nr:hypothetical protein [Chlorobiota bacterium]MCI0715549.1 hypothetical protein [Chlorobiota bacterium]